MPDARVLLLACDAAVVSPDLLPEYALDGTLLKTFCNLGARRVAQALGCRELDDLKLNADAMYSLMERNGSERWRPVTGTDAAAYARAGGLAYAALPSFHLGEAHGHIAAVRPDPMRASASAGGQVPMLANVGAGDRTQPLVPLGRGGLYTRPNWSCRASDAFPYKRVGPPTFFTWRP